MTEDEAIIQNEAIEKIREENNSILLGFSCGKDSIAAWLSLLGRFEKIYPVYMYLIPGLSFVEESLAYYERFFGCHIIRVAHPSLYRMLNAFVFQPPEHCEIIEDQELPDFTYEELNKWVSQDLGYEEQLWKATGVRSADSINRRRHFLKRGLISHSTKTFYPIAFMLKAELVALLKRHKIKLPIDYKLFGKTFDGLDYRFLKPIRDNFPDDYRKILEYFPLADLEIFRREHAKA